MKLEPNTTSDFDEFLKSENIFNEIDDDAIKRVIIYQLEQEMKAQKTCSYDAYKSWLYW